jgi:type IV pilus assembly protein PilB
LSVSRTPGKDDRPREPRPWDKGTPPKPAKPPLPGLPGAKPTLPSGAKPATPGLSGAKPVQPSGAKPVQPSGAKPTLPSGAKPALPGAKPALPSGAKPALPSESKPSQPPGAAKPANPRGIKIPTQKRIGHILIEMGKVTQAQLDEALALKRDRGGAIGAVLVDLGYCEPTDISAALAVQAGMRRVDLDTMDIPPEVIEKMDAMVARSYSVVPVEFADGKLTVAVSDPNNFRALDELHMLLDYEIVAAVADPQALLRALDKYYAHAESVEAVIGELGATAEWISERQEDIDLEDIRAMSESQPVKKLLNLVLLQAIRDKASDIHFEPFEDEFKMRYRIDGVLYEMVPPPRHIALAVASRIKVMSNLDIAERRMPQDGRIELTVGGKPVDLRVSVLPTMFGESVVMRVLDRAQVELDMRKLGLRDDDQKIVDDLIHLPNGIVIVTGPTGCGKTTTLYSALSAINTVDVKIITTEDPVEYDIDGLIQVQINPEIGLTFARCLRHILRQDPDIILVGEIRDLETAQTAIHSSLTGHLVFSTLHTNDAPTAITRLLDLGLEPYLVTATLEAVIAQRLVRRICTHCRAEFEPTEEVLRDLDLTPEEVRGRTFFFGKGCDQCNNTGYRGRTGIFEIMYLDDLLRDLILHESSTNVIREEAKKRGMRTLRDAGLIAIYDGVTTIEEVVRATVTAE